MYCTVLFVTCRQGHLAKRKGQIHPQISSAKQTQNRDEYFFKKKGGLSMVKPVSGVKYVINLPHRAENTHR